MTTTKKSYVARLGVLVVALTLVSTCLLGGTMAKYVTDVTGTGSATVAKWSFKANEKDATSKFTVDLASTAYDNVGDKRIAPGTKGSFDIVIDASGSEVAVDYTIAFSNLLNKPDNLTFYSDETKDTPISDLANYDGLNGTIALDKVNTKVTKTVYWEWPYETGSGDAIKASDAMDTTAGAKETDGDRKVSFDIVVTGTQKTPVEKPPVS